jgi:Ulp1 family protease
MDAKRITYYDGLPHGDKADSALNNCLSWVKDVALQHGMNFTQSEWIKSSSTDFPAQTDGSSCGIYAIAGMYMIAKYGSLHKTSFNCSEDVPYLRLLFARIILCNDFNILSL